VIRADEGWAPPIGHIARVPRVRPLNDRLWHLIGRELANALTEDETDELNNLCSQLEDEESARWVA
jgi:hypothetical protein